MGQIAQIDQIAQIYCLENTPHPITGTTRLTTVARAATAQGRNPSALSGAGHRSSRPVVAASIRKISPRTIYISLQ